MMTLKGKIALVTGAAKGIGREYALALAQAGADVAITYHTNKTEAKITVQLCERQHVRALALEADVENDAAIEHLIADTSTRLGALDILVCNVGDFIYKPTIEISAAEWEKIFVNNFSSVVRCVQAVLPMMQQKHWGRIITIGSVGADRDILRTHTLPYYIAKQAVIQYTKALAANVAPFGITANSISPGIMASSEVKHPVPAGRVGTPQDLVNAMLFLLKEESAYINGANIEIAGGWMPDLG